MHAYEHVLMSTRDVGCIHICNQLHFFVSGPFVLIQLTLNAYPTRVRQCDTSIALDFAQVLK